MIKNFEQVHKELNKFVPNANQPGSYSLDNMQQLMRSLGNPQEDFKVVHVAGTSGKTSTSYYIAALLKQAGQKVGLTVSPHIDEVNERVQINLEPLPEDIYCQELTEFLEIIEQTDISPTYFELLVAFAYWYFAKQKVDYAVIEVGLGGLLDGTNVIERHDKVCVITDIGLDHTNVLGKTLAEIAAQKAGIIKDHNVVVMYEQNTEIMQAIHNRCGLMHASLQAIDMPSQQDLPADLPLFQRRNWNLAKTVADYIFERDNLTLLNWEEINNAIHIRIPARMEVFNYMGKTIIIDGSHNEQKISTLIASVKDKYPNQPMAALISFGYNKSESLQGSLNLLTGIASHLIVTKFKLGQDEVRKPVDPEEIAVICQKFGYHNVITVENPKVAFEKLLERPEKLLLVTGSFYLLNHVRPLILK